MIIYQQCVTCGHQSQREMAQGGGFSSSPCEKCKSSNQNVQIGGDKKPAWWKP